jgi:hypothetical protein
MKKEREGERDYHRLIVGQEERKQQEHFFLNLRKHLNSFHRCFKERQLRALLALCALFTSFLEILRPMLASNNVAKCIAPPPQRRELRWWRRQRNCNYSSHCHDWSKSSF